MAAFCRRCSSSCFASAAWPSGSRGRTAMTFALGRMLGIAILTKKLAAVSMAIAGQRDDSMIRCREELLDQLHVTLGNITMAVRPSALSAVYLIDAPPEWQPGDGRWCLHISSPPEHRACRRHLYCGSTIRLCACWTMLHLQHAPVQGLLRLLRPTRPDCPRPQAKNKAVQN